MSTPPLAVPPAVTAYERDLLIAALHVTEPQTAYRLAGATVGGPRRQRLAAYLKAGFLIEHRRGRHVTYTITPAGRELAEYLSRLEAAREDR